MTCECHGKDIDAVSVWRGDLKHLLDVYINNGMVEPEDEDIINRLWRQVGGN